MEFGSSGGTLQAWRRGGMEFGSLGGALWSSGGMLQACRRAGVQACRREILMRFDGVCSRSSEARFALPLHGEPRDSVAKRRPT